MEHRYLKALVTFTYDKAGNVGNLSRMDPSLLGVKDANTYTKNALYLHGLSSSPLLCFSLVLVTRDNHEHGRSFGSEPKEWILKDIAGVLPAIELERFVAVLGLAYDLPYVPNDSARREGDLLYLSMIDNAFCFTTSMVSKAGECSLADFFLGGFCLRLRIEFEKAKAGSSVKSTPKRMNTSKIFAPASLAFSKAAVLSTSARKPTLQASETGMDGKCYS